MGADGSRVLERSYSALVTARLKSVQSATEVYSPIAVSVSHADSDRQDCFAIPSLRVERRLE